MIFNVEYRGQETVLRIDNLLVIGNSLQQYWRFIRIEDIKHVERVLRPGCRDQIFINLTQDTIVLRTADNKMSTLIMESLLRRMKW